MKRKRQYFDTGERRLRLGDFYMKLTAKRILDALGRYFDDLLLLCGGACLTAGAYGCLGRPAALLTAGACLIGYAAVVARSKGGGG